MPPSAVASVLEEVRPESFTDALIAFFVRQCRKRAAVAQALEAQRRGARRATRRSARGQAPRRTATTFFSKYYMNSSRIKGGKASS